MTSTGPSVPTAGLTPAGSRALAAALLMVLFIYAAWLGAWTLERSLEASLDCMGTRTARSAYFLVMKLVIWVVPAVLVIRLSGASVREAYGLARPRTLLAWGLGVGLGLALITVSIKLATHGQLLSTPPGWPLANAVIVAPITEELPFRGALLPALRDRFGFVSANLITAVLFTGAHLPGWFFRGSLLENLTSPFGAVSILMLGYVFGWVAHRSRSVAASSLVHALSNLAYS